MNKEYEKFRCENEGIIENLLESLNILLKKLEQGIIPENSEKLDAIYRLNVYKDAINLFNKVETPIFQRIQTETIPFDEDIVYKELLGIKDSISLLFRLSREKIIPINDPDFQTDSGKILLEGKYCDEVIIEGSEIKYYTLSIKAEKILKNKNIANKIRKENATAIIPNNMIPNTDTWNNLYVRRVKLLQQYYSKKRIDKEYILFTLDNSEEMVFGCELSDESDITYTFAGIFDEKIHKHIEQLKKLIDFGHIDHIIIIIDSKEIAKVLEDNGIDEKHISHISIEQLK